MTSLKAVQRIEGGTVGRTASNCYGNWNFANKYFSIACFSNKLTYSFHYLVPLLFPYPSFISVHPFLSYLRIKGKIILVFEPVYLPPCQIQSGNTLFIHWDRKCPYYKSGALSLHMCHHTKVLGGMVSQEPPPNPDSQNNKGLLMTCESPDFSKLPFPGVHEGNAALK